MPNDARAARVEAEIEAALLLVEEMLGTYLDFSDKPKVGESQWQYFSEILDYTNVRAETVSSLLLLIRNDKIADALGLSRSLLEHLQLLRLMVRGRHHVLVEESRRRTGEEWRAALREKQDELAKHHAKGEWLNCLRVMEHPGRSRQIMWLFEGPIASGEPEVIVPMHYFHFQDFRPEQHRLKDDGSLLWFPSNYEGMKVLKEASQKHKREAKFRYDYYLSWGAILTFLQLNELATPVEVERIESHYTFLGQFLHPTHEAARDLHEMSNHHLGGTAIGLQQRYDRHAVLLAALYAVWLMRGILEEVADMFDAAPPEYISDPGTGDLHALIDAVPDRFSYFWFISNRAPLFDRFEHAVRVGPDENGGYIDIPDDVIRFEWNTYEQLKKAMTGQSVPATGMRYDPPIV
jgi:hypothetical protein